MSYKGRLVLQHELAALTTSYLPMPQSGAKKKQSDSMAVDTTEPKGQKFTCRKDFFYLPKHWVVPRSAKIAALKNAGQY
jgi:hypothetical protein